MSEILQHEGAAFVRLTEQEVSVLGQGSDSLIADMSEQAQKDAQGRCAIETLEYLKHDPDNDKRNPFLQADDVDKCGLERDPFYSKDEVAFWCGRASLCHGKDIAHKATEKFEHSTQMVMQQTSEPSLG